jgi:predicted ATP-dependent protease
MFETQEFRQMLTATFGNAATKRCLSGFDSTIIDELQNIAVSETGVFIEASADVLPIEVRSAQTIAEQAAHVAQAANRSYITWTDVEAVLELNFCTVYPFCKPK